ncbi:DNA topoisomerase IB [Actinoplanes sp. NPDC049596]|uniref:DNA topoisomerase IB n=1 Tax=unclassified Actinoplanes TaxID=2626549 RepID=UPI00342FE503
MNDAHPRPPGYHRAPARAANAHDRGVPEAVRYTDDAGRPVSDAGTLAHIHALKVPPAWRNVWIAADPHAKVQAVGTDAAGRTQYRYSAEWTTARAGDKFAHLPDFAGALPVLRDHVGAELGAGPRGRRTLDRDRVLSIAARLLDLGFFRVGSERYARDNETYGLTTLLRDHVRVSRDAVHFDYIAKEHKHRVVEVTDPTVAGWVRRLIARDDHGPEFLAWHRADGTWQPVHSAHVNAYIHTHTGIDATAKQFRTWAGTVLAAAALGGARHDQKAKTPINAAVRATSALLGNTPAVARASYIHPTVLTAFEAGRTITPAVTEAATRLNDDRLSVLWRDPTLQAATATLIAET